MATNTILEAAHELHQAGISVVPVKADGSKRPDGPWKQYTTGRATPNELRAWFATGNPGIGAVTGPISGNLELLEVEGRAAERLAELASLAADNGLQDVWQRICTGWLEQSPSGGWHWLYRATPPEGVTFPGNTKIAKDEAGLVLAETRSANGFVVLAPSSGTVHPTGKPWVRLAGGPATVPTISWDEREALHAVFAAVLDAPEPEPEAPSELDLALSGGPTRSTDGGISPGDDFEAKTDWAQILTGWTHVTTRGRTRYWRRPGKDTPGFSATTGRDPERDRLYVFTSSTVFQQEIPYTKFGAYALLNHGGDHMAAAQALQKGGYGQRPAPRLELVPDPAQRRPEPVAPPAPSLTVVTTTAGTSALATVTSLDDRRHVLAETDTGNARLLVEHHGEQLRYCTDRGRWLAWNGTVWVWQPADGGLAREYAKDIAARLPAGNTAEVNFRRKALSAKGTTDMLIQARTDPRITVTMADLDAHPWELNTPAGIIDLTTGTLMPADPAKLHTRTTACAPDPTADTRLWGQFLATTFQDPELTGYMQRLTGYSTVGQVREHILPFAYGLGGNGKGAFLEAIRAVLGDYATTSPNGFLMASNYAQHSTEIARLAGARMVICSEVNEGDKFDEAKVKQLTGGDTLTARFMRQDDFTFTPTHHLWLMGNNQPAVESGGNSFWRRIRLIPFTHTVNEDERIEDLQGILARDHGPALLNWIAQGAAHYHQHGLQEPASVTEATKDYAHDVDTVARFLEEDCTLHPGPNANSFATTTSGLRNAYDAWCKANGETPLRGRTFVVQLSKHGITTGLAAPRTTTNRMYGGVTLNSSENEPDEHDGDRGGF
jgi:P4 family phage/plasmid primase-like protien